MSPGPPLLQASNPKDRSVCFACSLPGDGDGRQQVLVVRLQEEGVAGRDLEPSNSGGGGSSSGVAAEACLLAEPAGCRVLDVALYKEQQLAVLSQEEGAGEVGCF